MKKGLLQLMALAAVFTIGCFRATFVRPVPPAGAVHEEWHSFWLFGIVGERDVDVHEYCPNGKVRMIRTGGNVGTSLVALVTLGIYTPRKTYVQCSDETSSSHLPGVPPGGRLFTRQKNERRPDIPERMAATGRAGYSRNPSLVRRSS